MRTPLYAPYARHRAARAAGVLPFCLVSWLITPPALGQTTPASEASGMATEAPEATPGAPTVADGGVVRDDQETAANPKLVRVTSSFEVTYAGAVLRQVARLFSAGFVRKDAEQIARMIDALAAEQSRTWEFTGVRKGVGYPLRVRARIDEFGMLDLDFFTVPALAASVRSAVDGYLNARGL